MGIQGGRIHAMNKFLDHTVCVLVLVYFVACTYLSFVYALRQRAVTKASPKTSSSFPSSGYQPLAAAKRLTFLSHNTRRSRKTNAGKTKCSMQIGCWQNFYTSYFVAYREETLHMLGRFRGALPWVAEIVRDQCNVHENWNKQSKQDIFYLDDNRRAKNSSAGGRTRSCSFSKSSYWARAYHMPVARRKRRRRLHVVIIHI